RRRPRGVLRGRLRHRLGGRATAAARVRGSRAVHRRARVLVDVRGLRRVAAELVARHPWPRLYDDRRLAENDVPVAAVIYTNDMYVDRELSEETASRVRNLRPWLTNEYEHDGIRRDRARVLDRLIGLARGD